MAGRTRITDVADLADLNDPSVEVPAPARRLAEFIGRIIHETTSRPSGHPATTDVPCRRRGCEGRIQGRLEGLARVVWSCERCAEHGVISNWRGCMWDMTGRSTPRREPSGRTALAPRRPPGSK